MNTMEEIAREAARIICNNWSGEYLSEDKVCAAIQSALAPLQAENNELRGELDRIKEIKSIR